MPEQTISIAQIHEEYSKFIESCNKFSSFTRSIRIQKEKVAECDRVIQFIKGYREQAVELSNEIQANQFFHLLCTVNAMRSVMLMWVAVKEGDFEKGWCSLVDAQEYTAVGLKAKDYEGIRNLKENLNCIEKSIFPGWTLYNSPGWTESIGDCSICGDSFSVCDHIENQIYMGRLCQRTNRKIIEIEHSALVEEPRDRRCIITEVSNDEGEMIDYFTWEKTGEKEALGEDTSMRTKGTILSFSTLDL